MANPPTWVEVRQTMNAGTVENEVELGPGETAAIELAAELHADLLLIDDRRGAAVALRKGLVVAGTMGLPARAAKRWSARSGQSIRQVERRIFVIVKTSWIRSSQTSPEAHNRPGDQDPTGTITSCRQSAVVNLVPPDSPYTKRARKSTWGKLGGNLSTPRRDIMRQFPLSHEGLANCPDANAWNSTDRCRPLAVGYFVQ